MKLNINDFEKKAEEMDPLEEANKVFEAEERSKAKRPLKEMGDASVAESTGQFGDAGSSRTVKATPKAAPKPAVKLIDPSNIRSGRREFEESQIAPKLIDPSNIRSGRREFEESQIVPVDETKLSLSERMKLSRARSKAGSGPTDKRSVNERVRSMFGMKSGGSVSSASRRADGIATKGKTRGKIC
jgi:hypothetical protein